jgi:hypothetical protein
LSRVAFPGLTLGISAPAHLARTSAAGLPLAASMATSTIIITYFIMLVTSL